MMNNEAIMDGQCDDFRRAFHHCEYYGFTEIAIDTLKSEASPCEKLVFDVGMSASDGLNDLLPCHTPVAKPENPKKIKSRAGLQVITGGAQWPLRGDSGGECFYVNTIYAKDPKADKPDLR